jgi:hypothetical protein
VLLVEVPGAVREDRHLPEALPAAQYAPLRGETRGGGLACDADGVVHGAVLWMGLCWAVDGEDGGLTSIPFTSHTR